MSHIASRPRPNYFDPAGVICRQIGEIKRAGAAGIDFDAIEERQNLRSGRAANAHVCLRSWSAALGDHDSRNFAKRIAGLLDFLVLDLLRVDDGYCISDLTDRLRDASSCYDKSGSLVGGFEVDGELAIGILSEWPPRSPVPTK